MRGIDTLLAILSNFPLLSKKPDLASNSNYGLKLTHVIGGEHQALYINDINNATALHFVQTERPLKSKVQMIPKFDHHKDAESVLRSWKASLDRRRGVSASFWGDNMVEVNRQDPRQWKLEATEVPDITDKFTVLTLAKLAANAYVPTPFEGDWSDVNGTESGGWNHEGNGYGWDDDAIRGYIFTSEDLSTMVISIKGTSTAVLDAGGPTAPNDKINDNLFFSCCCARVNRMWSTVCDCFMGENQCDEQCLEAELWHKDRYYRRALNVYEDARKLVPEAKTVWITGHSLGGSLASMLGRTFGVPVVTFESPGEELPVKRLHLPVPPGLSRWEDHVWHFGHNADPIFMGTCSGGGSTCSLKGYAMETKCHTGLVCVYDAKTDLGWRESIVNHRIHVVIDNILEVYDEPAPCSVSDFCEDCYNWEFVDIYDTEPSQPSQTATKTATTVTKTATSTSIVTTTGGKTSTSTSARPTSTSQLTSSCLSRAWYGRCEKWTTFPVTKTSSDRSSSTCLTYNFFGICEKWRTYHDTSTSTQS